LGAGTPRLEITFDMNDEGLLFSMATQKYNVGCKYQTFGRQFDGAVKRITVFCHFSAGFVIATAVVPTSGVLEYEGVFDGAYTQ